MINTNKVAFVGDLHLDSTTPSSRVDDYADSSIAKLNALKNTCLIRDIKVVILLGDVFNKHDQSNTYINKVLKVFQAMKKEGILVYSIVGNHDLSFERMDTMDRSPLQMLFTSGLIKHLTHEVIGNDTLQVHLFGLDYPDNPIPVSEQPEHGLVNVLCTHRFYNYAFNDPHNLSSQDCLTLGYQLYAMGHDHIQYDVEKCQAFWVIRPGSFMRTSSHRYNLERQILIDVIEFKGTSDNVQLISTREVIQSKPANEVFSTSVYQRGEESSITDELNTLHDRVSELLNKMGNSGSTHQDVFKVLDEICYEPEVKACIETYLQLGGYTRNEEKLS